MAMRIVRSVPFLVSVACVVGLFTGSGTAQSAKPAVDLSDLSDHIAGLGSKRATERGQSVRKLIAAGAAAIPHLRRVLAAVEESPPRPPTWNRNYHYPAVSLWDTEPTLDSFGATRPTWSFLRQVPLVPRPRRGRLRLGRTAWNPRVVAAAVLWALDVEEQVRVRELLRLLADGETSPSMARSLGVGESTVRTHVERMRDKWGVNTRAGLVALGFRLGFLE